MISNEIFVHLSLVDFSTLRVELYKQLDGFLYFDKLISCDEITPGDRFCVSICGYFDGSNFIFKGDEVCHV